MGKNAEETSNKSHVKKQAKKKALAKKKAKAKTAKPRKGTKTKLPTLQKKQKGKIKSAQKKKKKGKHESSLGESLRATASLYRQLQVVDKHVTYDHNGKCDYKPPAGCGCEGTTLPQQTQPRELGENDDPTSKGDCPAMPA